MYRRGRWRAADLLFALVDEAGSVCAFVFHDRVMASASDFDTPFSPRHTYGAWADDVSIEPWLTYGRLLRVEAGLEE